MGGLLVKKGLVTRIMPVWKANNKAELLLLKEPESSVAAMT